MSEIRANQGETAPSEAQATSPNRAPIAGHAIELILARQLAGYLALAVVIVDPSWSVIYYNEPAERILGRRFDEAGPVPWTAWTNAFHFTDAAGKAIPAEEIPVLSALRSRQISHLDFWMLGLDGVRRHVGALGIPLVGNAGRFHGTVGIFQEIEP
jgi:PAS domain-containing protein